MQNKKYDVFPAIAVVAPPGSFEDINTISVPYPLPTGAKKKDRIRVVVLNGKIMIAEDAPMGIRLIFNDNVSEISVDGQIIRVLTESDKAVVFKKDNNCGCGSRLRSWNPYGSMMYSSQDPL